MSQELTIEAIFRARDMLDAAEVPPIKCFYDPYKDEVVEATEQNAIDFRSAVLNH